MIMITAFNKIKKWITCTWGAIRVTVVFISSATTVLCHKGNKYEDQLDTEGRADNDLKTLNRLTKTEMLVQRHESLSVPQTVQCRVSEW
jgi:hypothetical protein